MPSSQMSLLQDHDEEIKAKAGYEGALPDISSHKAHSRDLTNFDNQF